MDRTSNLRSELDGFLAEVDAIKSESLAFFDMAPSCEWIVHVDPVTRLSVYQHLPSGQTNPNMPEEYERYLSQFNQFLEKHQQQQTLVQPVERFEQSECTSIQNDEPSPIRVHKRKHTVPGEEMANTTSASSLNALLGYSDSSGTETDVHDGLNARQRRRLKRAHRRHARVNGPSVDTGSSLTPEPSSFIGPLLPGSVPDTVQEQESIETVAAKSPTSTEAGNAHSDAVCALGSVYSPRPRDVDKNSIEDSVQSIFDQFACLNVALPEIARLHVLFIQLSTRLEDWKCGFLSSKYFVQKIHDVATELTQIVTRGLPPNWTCSWDIDNGRFCYKDNVTGRMQYQPPSTKEPSRCIPRTADNSEAKRINLDFDNVNEPEGRQISATNDGTLATNRLSGLKVVGSSSADDITVIKDDSQSQRQQPMLAPGTTTDLPLPQPNTESSLTALDDRFPDDDVDFGDRTEHLKAQLLEFEEVCRALEYLDASSVTIRDEDPEHVSSDCAISKELKSEKVKSQDKHAKLLPSNPLSGSKALPGLMRKWQQLQESL